MGSSLLLKGGTNTPKSIEESFSLANTFLAGDAIRYDIPSSTWVKAQADSAENSEVAGVVSSASFNTFNLIYSGYIQVSALSGVSAPVLFLDSTIAGGLTSSPPSAIGSVIKPVLTKTTNGSGYIVTNYLGTQIGGSSTVAIDEIQPVGTVVPFAGSAIPDSWLECNGNSYAVGAYPYLYSKLQYSSGDRVPAYGHVAVLTTVTPVNASNIGTFIQQGFGGTTVRAKIIAVTATTITVQTVPIYSNNAKNFVVNNTVFTTGFVQDDSSEPFAIITAVSITHFNTPDLRGRVALGVNTAAIPDTDNDSPNTNNSAISAIYSMGSQGGEEKNILPAVSVATSGSAGNVLANLTTNLLNNIPPYTVVRYIIKASPYTRAAIIDGIDIPYTSLLVGDLRDGTLRPGGIGEDLLFKTNDGSSGTERMRLTNTGNLLIGTTFNQPGHKFVVSGANGMGVEFLPGYIGNGSVIQAYDRSSPGTGYTTLRIDAEDFTFNTVGSGSFTINNSGQANIAATIDSTSPSTGVLTLGGGLGMAKNLTVGGGISAAGGITFSNLTRVTNNTAATSPTVAAFTVAGGIGAKGLHVGTDGQSIAGPLNVTGETRVDSAAASSSTTSGALRVVGGVGIQGALYVGGITTAGGISMGGALTVGGGITAARLDLGTGVMNSGSISTGTFTATSLAASSGTDSTAINIGALTVVGGAGIGKNLFVGGGITAAGSLDLGSGAIRTSGNINGGNIVSAGTFQATSLNATDTGSGALRVVGGAIIGGGISAAGGITFSGITRVTNATSATSTSVAALTVAGGVGIAGALYVGGITAAGGVSMGGALNVGGAVTVTNSTSSTSTTSGALVVAGGAGIAGALNTGATATFAGNVGIGTITPAALLNLSASNAVLNIENTLTTGGSGSVLRFGHNQTSDRRPVAEIKTILTDGSATRAGHLTISTSTSGTLSERMRITDTGYVGIGTTSINAKLEIVGAAAEAEALRVVVGTNSNIGVKLYEDGNSATFLRFRPFASPQTGFMFSDDGDTPILTIQTATDRVGIGTSAPAQALDVVGSILASDNITAFSDSRFKEDVKTIENALEKTQALNGVSYTDKASKEKRIGLIAQELKEVIPEVVFVNGDDQIHSVAYGNLVGLLVQAIKELNAKVDSLSAKVETLSTGGSE